MKENAVQASCIF